METFDVVIVGGGAAGCVLAARLSEDRSRRVLLLEAGGVDRHPGIRIPAAFPTLFDSALDWGYRTTSQPSLEGRSIFWPRGRVLGGSTSINAMMWVRGFPSDYDRWAEHSGPGWSYDELLPYFQRAEAVTEAVPGPFGRNGPLVISEQRDPNPLTEKFLEAAGECGIARNTARNDGPEEGVALTLVTQERGARVSASRGYLRPARQRSNLVVRTGATATHLSCSKGQVSSVSYLQHGRPRSVSGAVVICAAGAIGTPKLLLSSGIGPPDELRPLGIEVTHERREVGKNLSDHLSAGIALEARRPVSLAGARRAGPLIEYLRHRKGLLTSNVAEGYGYLRSSPELAECDLELLFVPAAFINEGLELPKFHGLTLATVLLQPASRGEVRLASADPRAAPTIDPRYLSDEAGSDLARLEEGVRRCIELARAPSLAKECGGLIAPPGELDETIAPLAVRRFAQTLYHPVGTCRMGRDDDAVVDPSLAVRGFTNLFVADASVMPTIPHGHTEAPTIAIAERAAALLATS